MKESPQNCHVCTIAYTIAYNYVENHQYVWEMIIPFFSHWHNNLNIIIMDDGHYWEIKVWNLLLVRVSINIFNFLKICSSWPNGHGVWLRTRRFQVQVLAGKIFLLRQLCRYPSVLLKMMLLSLTLLIFIVCKITINIKEGLARILRLFLNISTFYVIHL